MVVESNELRSVLAVKAVLRDMYVDLRHAIADLDLKDHYREGEGARYPDKQLVRRVWFYGEPGTDGVPQPGDPNPNGLLALAGMLQSKRGIMKRGFWSVLSECVGLQVPGYPIAVRIAVEDVETYFRSYPGWESKLLPASWPEFVAAENCVPDTFPWRAEIDGDHLIFTPTGREDAVR
ncbi:MAG: hypothetical protein IT348_10335 [Candidatus Eisenbacteria bacterium]|nr:hypothetical protein [Candidatus Eisenbacteria bacterium]